MKAFCLSLRLDLLFRAVRLNPCFVLALLTAACLALGLPARRPRIDLDLSSTFDVTGQIASSPELLESALFFEMSPISLRQGQKMVLDYPARLGVYVFFDPETSQPQDWKFEYGDQIRFTAFLDEPGYYAIPGVADFRETLWLQDILHTVQLKSPLLIETVATERPFSLRRPLLRYRRQFENFCFNRFPQGEARLLLSAFLGYKTLLVEEDRNRLKKLGIMHLFVISGFHVSLIVLLCHPLLRRLGGVGTALAIVLVWSYVLLVGASPSTLRAGVMTSLLYLCLRSGLKRRLLNFTGLAGLGLLIYSPRLLSHAGFQFSFLAVCALGLFALTLQPGVSAFCTGFQQVWSGSLYTGRKSDAKRARRVRYRLEEVFEFLPRPLARSLLRGLHRPLKAMLSVLLCSLWIQLFLFPLTLYYMNYWIWSQPLANLVLVPLFSVLLPLCFLLFATFWSLPGFLFALLTGATLRVIDGTIRALESISGGLYLPHPTALEMASYWIAFLFLFWLLQSKLKYILLAVFPFFLMIVLRLPPPRPPHWSGLLMITMLDVGQGESLHLVYPGGSQALVDTGGFRTGTGDHFVGERLVGRYLWTLRSRHLNFVLLSHPHADHIQGYSFLKQAFPVGRLYFHEYVEQYQGAVLHPLRAGDHFSIEGVEHEVLHPSRATSAWSTNDRSLVLRIRYRGFSMLLTGDIESRAEAEILPFLGKTTFLKIAHHGGKSSSLTAFIQRVTAQAALVSAGRRNSFGHPAAQTLRRFVAAGVPVYSTARLGSLRVETDGRNWQLLRYVLEEKAFRRIRSGRSVDG